MRGIFGLLLLLATPVFAQDLARAERIETMWRAWALDNGFEASAIAIGYQGELVHSAGIGREAGDPVPVASLSKAITAACVKDVMAEARLPLDTPIGEIFGGDLAGLGISSADNASLLVSAFITHSAGLGIDVTQMFMADWRDDDADHHRETAGLVLGRKTDDAREGVFAYNNTNYSVLGALVAELTGETYFEACHARVFPNDDVGAYRLSDRWGAFAAFGGWEISAEDYLQFVHQNFGDESDIGRDPLQYAAFQRMEGGQFSGQYYGMGSDVLEYPDGSYDFWHFGLLCFFDGVTAGAYFGSFGGDWSVVVNYVGCPDFSVQTDLHELMLLAIEREF